MTPLLTTRQMAEFVANGVLRFESIVPPELNERVLAELPALRDRKFAAFRGRKHQDHSPEDGPATGTPLSQCHRNAALAHLFELPVVRGIVQSLVGPEPRFDHDFVHHLPAGHPDRQHLHADAVVDTVDPTFDIQLFYFPHDVRARQGGTRFVPGTHLRRATSASIGRYQHVVGEQHFVGPAGTILVFHHGLWHSGDDNPSDQDRWMYKIRLNPAVPQIRLWDTSDFAAVHNDPTDHVFATSRSDSVASILRTRHRWQGEDAFRYDLIERVKFWRYLSGDGDFDADHYLTRLARPVPESLDRS